MTTITIILAILAILATVLSIINDILAIFVSPLGFHRLRKLVKENQDKKYKECFNELFTNKENIKILKKFVKLDGKIKKDDERYQNLLKKIGVNFGITIQDVEEKISQIRATAKLNDIYK